jgi:cytochrome c oxidase subunit 1
MYPEGWGKFAALLLFVGFNLTFFPQFILGYLGMPRRYYTYAPEYQVLNVMSTAGASILAVGFALPIFYLLWSLRWGELAPANPWNATGLEWQTPSPPPTHNFDTIPIVTDEPYEYSALRSEEGYEHAVEAAQEQLAQERPDFEAQGGERG